MHMCVCVYLCVCECVFGLSLRVLVHCVCSGRKEVKKRSLESAGQVMEDG